MHIPDRLEEFGFLLLSILAISFPLIAAALVRWRTKHPIPRPLLFVFLSAALVYGVGTMLSLIGALLAMVNSFLGAGAQSQGHNWLFQASQYFAQYSFLVLVPILLAISVILPVRASRSWSSLVRAWT